MHTGRVEAGEPHVADDDQFQGIVGIPHPGGQELALGLGGVVTGDGGTVGRAGGHHYLDGALGKVVIVPIGVLIDDGLVEGGGNAAGHGDNHSLTGHGFRAEVEMLGGVEGDLADALGVADDGLYLSPAGLGLFVFGQFADLLVKVGDELAPLLGEFDLGQAAFVIDGDGGTIIDGLLNIVDIDVVTEDADGISVRPFDGRPGEAEVGSPGEGVAEVFGVAVDGGGPDLGTGLLIEDLLLAGRQAILGAVGLVGDDDDVLAVAQLVEDVALVGGELLDGREDDAAGLAVEEFLEVGGTTGLDGFLT